MPLPTSCLASRGDPSPGAAPRGSLHPRAVLLVRLIVLAAAIGAPPAAAQPAAPPRRAAAPLVYDTALMAQADSGRILGSAQAKVWIVMLSDFQCPFCKAWHDSTDAALRARYVNTGKVRVAFLNFPIPQHKNAPMAAEVAMCAAAQRKFWGVHDALFAAQDKWAKLPDPTAFFEAIVAAQGVDKVAHRKCVADHKLRLLVEADVNRGSKAGVNSTPSFFIGDTALVGAVPREDFLKVVDAMVARATARKGK